MSIAFAVKRGDPARGATPLLAVALPAESGMPKALAALDKATSGAISTAIRARISAAARMSRC
jgi:hypothetical protein